ncbi:MAG: hypothetical protein KGJ23_04335 [Euryarchaeota archaeon]|nr:hypothetical protein [Euryarchaeota archaeon]MDE2045802.1 hypothetical protein [Thermoplasmata archaeon]
MDLDAILAGIAERDKWSGRLSALQGELRLVRARRRRAEGKLRRMDRELRRLRALAEQLVRSTPVPGRGGWGPGGPPTSYLPIR